MRIAAFGDIHSNHIALEACMEEAERAGIDAVLFLGDYVSDCAEPQKTLALIRDIAGKYPCRFIRGNREEYMIDHADGRNVWRHNSQSGSLLYTYENLTKKDIAWFREMPVYERVQWSGGPDFEICHGAPWQSRVMMLPGTEDMERAFEEMQTNLLLCAHTHEAFIAEHSGRMIVNGGPVGVPAKGMPGACFALIELRQSGWMPRLMRVDYDAEAVIREFRESGFMESGRVWARAMAATLRDGQDYSVECLTLVGEYSRQSGLPFDEEELWLRAAEKLGI